MERLFVKIKILIKNLLLLLLPALVVIVIAFELFFRFIIPATQAPYYFFDEKYNIMKLATQPTRDGMTTAGPLAQMKAIWHINNEGWNSAIDYLENPDKPVIAIFGASLIEALHVNTNESVAAKLQEMLQEKYYVYNFGISGGVLSNMLNTTRYATKRFDPKLLVFNITPGTILPSLCGDAVIPGMCLRNTENGFSEIIKPYTPKSTYRFLRRSATVRYLYQNIGIDNLKRLLPLPKFLHAAEKNNQHKVVHDNSESPESIKLMEENILDYILKTIKVENQERDVIILYSYSNREKKLYTKDRLQHEFDIIQNKCAKYGLYFIDLGKELKNIEETSRKGIDFGFDDHWNAFGHESVAKKLYSELTNNILEERK